MKQRALAFGPLLLLALTACGSSSSNKDTGTTPTTSATTYTWTKDVQPIVASTCATSGCHKTGALGAGSPALDTQATFVAQSTSITSDLNTGKMPQAPTTISAANKQILLDYLAQSTKN